jgi:hypothetical protein
VVERFAADLHFEGAKALAHRAKGRARRIFGGSGRNRDVGLQLGRTTAEMLKQRRAAVAASRVQERHLDRRQGAGRSFEASAGRGRERLRVGGLVAEQLVFDGE